MGIPSGIIKAFFPVGDKKWVWVECDLAYLQSRICNMSPECAMAFVDTIKNLNKGEGGSNG